MAEVTTFSKDGRNWRRITVDPIDRYVVGVCLAPERSAVCVLHYTRQPLDTWTTRELRNQNGIVRQDHADVFAVEHVEKLPAAAYPEQCARVGEIMFRRPVKGADLVLDMTQVGAPVADLLDAAGLRPERISLSTGSGGVANPASRLWIVPRSLLLSVLDTALHSNQLRVASDLAEAGAVADELRALKLRADSDGALALAVAAAVYWSAGKPRVGEVSAKFGAAGSY